MVILNENGDTRLTPKSTAAKIWNRTKQKLNEIHIYDTEKPKEILFKKTKSEDEKIEYMGIRTYSQKFNDFENLKVIKCAKHLCKMLFTSKPILKRHPFWHCNYPNFTLIQLKNSS